MVCCLERVTCDGVAEPWRNHGREIFLRAFWAIVAGFPAGDVMIRNSASDPTIGVAYGYGLQTYERDRDAQKDRNDVVMVLDNALSFTGHILERATTRGAFAIADGTPPFLYLFFLSSLPPSFSKKVRALPIRPTSRDQRQTSK